MRRVALAVAGAALLAPSAAGAATISSAAHVVSLAALPGELNTVRVTPAADGGVDVVDAVPVQIGTGCIATSERTAHCPGPVVTMDLDLGDGRDSFAADRALTIGLVVHGGTGDDRLDGGSGADVLDGGLGSDTLNGAAGGDRLLGGDGADLLLGDTGSDDLAGGEGDDRLDGGTRNDAIAGGGDADTVTYASRTDPVRVTLDALGGDGEVGENDAIAQDVENVEGGAGDDLLEGADGANVLDGGAGSDTIRGGAGADLLRGGAGDDALSGDGRSFDPEAAGDDGDVVEGGPGRDRLTGDAGHDALEGGDGDDVVDAREPPGTGSPGEVVGCGSGYDSARIDEADSAVDCEDVKLNTPPPEIPPVSPGSPPAAGAARPPGSGSRPPLGVPVLRGGAVLLPVVCAATTDCRVRAAILAAPPRAKGRRGGGSFLAGRATATVPAGARAVVRVGLTRTARARLRRAGRLRAVAEVSISPAGGRPLQARRPVVLRHGK